MLRQGSAKTPMRRLDARTRMPLKIRAKHDVPVLMQPRALTPRQLDVAPAVWKCRDLREAEICARSGGSAQKHRRSKGSLGK